VASLFTFGRCPSFFRSTFRLLQFIFQRHPDFLTTRHVAWQVLLWHLLKPLFVALMVCKNLTIHILYYCVVRELAWVFFYSSSFDVRTKHLLIKVGKFIIVHNWHWYL
jgi:hypothetical protein